MRMTDTKEIYQELQDAIAGVADKVENGKATYIDALIFMRDNRGRLEDTLELIKQWETDCYDEIVGETLNYPDGYKGRVFEIRGGRKTYDFSGIPEVEDAERRFKEAKEKYKSMFVAKQKGALYANVGEDGEELRLPEIGYGAGSIVVKRMRRR